MGITRDGLHKRRPTGGKHTKMHKKRKYAMGRPAAMTRIGAYRVHQVRARGGNLKERAIRLEQGTYAWGSEAVNKNARIIEVVYNASNNELVRTNTLVKGAVVNIDATPFLNWYKSYYGVNLTNKTKPAPPSDPESEKKAAKLAARIAARDKKRAKWFKKLRSYGLDVKGPHIVSDAQRAKRATGQVIDPAVAEQMKSGRVLARISTRPGQMGAASGYILEGAELAFYQRKIQKKR